MLLIKGEDKFIFNENYLLKFDQKRFELMERCTNRLYQEYSEDDAPEDLFLSIHPMLGLLIYLFDGKRTINEVTETFSKITGFNREEIKRFAMNMLNELNKGEKGKYLKFGNNIFYLPKNLFIKNGKPKIKRDLTISDFQIPHETLDLETMRSYIPSDCILQINFKCFTDCLYCYADRQNQITHMPLAKIKEIIKEAKELRMRTFDLSGGEVFLYENWEELIKELLNNGFTPYVSTKVPLSETTIKKIKDSGLKGIQISIDSLDNNELKHLLNVNDDYIFRMLKTIECLDREGLQIATNTQITVFNEDLLKINQLLKLLVSFKNIKTIRLGAVGYSLYKPQGSFEKIASNLETILKIEELIDTFKVNHPNVSINFSGYTKASTIDGDTEEKTKNFQERVRCSGNFYAFIILPDGKVTICEQLYYHPQFIIGDIQKQSIAEIWNSEKALELYHITSKMMSKKSACNGCEIFDTCHKTRGVCWRNILIAYGKSNWDYPDPTCPKSPKPLNKYWYN